MPGYETRISRREWKAFKSKYPQFERAKSFKSDVGPEMDKCEQASRDLYAARTAWNEAEKAFERQREETAKLYSNLLAAMSGYKAVVEELADKKIEADFMKIYDAVERFRQIAKQNLF
jgi:hypothetical protein